jgi:hypothetical protein
MRIVVRSLAVVLVVGLLGRALAAPPVDENAKKAREAFTDGTTYFNLGQWERAIESWQAGYKHKPDPIFLYNIAQAYRLAENHEKAVFFYKSYLRNSPKAPNRQEVQDKIDQLQKLLDQKRAAREAAPEGALSPGEKPAAPTPQPPPQAQPQTTGATAEVVREAPRPMKPRRADLSVQGGVDFWALGAGGFTTAAGVALSGGYDVWQNDRLALRVGAKVGYSYLSDTHSTDHFISLLADPMLRIRLWRERLYAFVEVGVGALIVAGLSNGSTMLVPRALPSGSFAAFELRPALGLEYRIVPAFALFLTPTLIYSPSPHQYFASSSLVRLDVDLGASIRF